MEGYGQVTHMRILAISFGGTVVPGLHFRQRLVPDRSFAQNAPNSPGLSTLAAAGPCFGTMELDFRGISLARRCPATPPQPTLPSGRGCPSAEFGLPESAPNGASYVCARKPRGQVSQINWILILFLLRLTVTQGSSIMLF